MYINKKSDTWKKAPWHVKMSAYGVKTVQGLRNWKNVSFSIGLLFFMVGTLGSVLELGSMVTSLFSFSCLGLAACMYWFALDWIRDNESVLQVE